jgi:hypothetical protein
MVAAICNQAGGILAAAAACAVALVAATAAEAKVSEAPASVRIAPLRQHDVLTDGVALELRSARATRTRVAVGLRFASGAVALGTRTVRVSAGEVRRLRFPLSPRARAMASSCQTTRATATARAAGVRRTTTRGVQADPPCSRFFGPAAVWNVPLADDAPLDPNNSAITAELRRQVAEGYQSGMAPTINTTAYSSPIYTVPSGAPTTRVIVDQPAGSAGDLPQAFAAVPLPDVARPAAGSDAQAFVWQPSTDTIWEFWQLRRASDGWHARWGGRLDNVSTGPGHFDGPRSNWGATGTSLPLAGGLMTLSELSAGRIDHALALAVPRARAHEFALPAQRTDGQSNATASIPEGARFRIDPSVDLATLGLPPALLPIARAAQRYGIIVRDRGGAVALYAEDPTPLGSNPYPALFGGKASDLMRKFPWTKLRLMKMSLQREPGTSSPVAPVVCGLLPCP